MLTFWASKSISKMFLSMLRPWRNPLWQLDTLSPTTLSRATRKQEAMIRLMASTTDSGRVPLGSCTSELVFGNSTKNAWLNFSYGASVPASIPFTMSCKMGRTISFKFRNTAKGMPSGPADEEGKLLSTTSMSARVGHNSSRDVAKVSFIRSSHCCRSLLLVFFLLNTPCQYSVTCW